MYLFIYLSTSLNPSGLDDHSSAKIVSWNEIYTITSSSGMYTEGKNVKEMENIYLAHTNNIYYLHWYILQINVGKVSPSRWNLSFL